MSRCHASMTVKCHATMTVTRDGALALPPFSAENTKTMRATLRQVPVCTPDHSTGDDTVIAGQRPRVSAMSASTSPLRNLGKGTEGCVLYQKALFRTALGHQNCITHDGQILPMNLPRLPVGSRHLDAGASPARFGHGHAGQLFPSPAVFNTFLAAGDGIVRRCLARERSLQRGHGRRDLIPPAAVASTLLAPPIERI